MSRPIPELPAPIPRRGGSAWRWIGRAILRATGWGIEGNFPALAKMVVAVAPHTSPNGVWMGGFLSATDNLYQAVTIPASATALQLTGQRWIGTEETGGTYDTVRVQLRDSGGALLEQLVQWSNSDNGTA